MSQLFKPAEAAKAGPVPERAAGKEDDTETTAVVIKPPSMWEQAFNKAQDSPLLGGLLGAFRGIFSGVGNVSSTVSDRVFGENENAEALALLKERDAAFAPGPFVEHCEGVLIPKVIAAYLKGDLPALRETCTEAAYASLHSNVQARIAQQWFMDRRILDLSSVELVGMRLVNEEPTAVVQFQTQQVNCVRDAGGRIVEGAEDDIRAVYYMMALQQHLPVDPKADVTEEQIDTRPSVERWVVTEVAIRGALQTW
jgi:import inner membrane translocase subunit TIM44